MNDTDLLRYSRQIMLPELDVEGQEKLAQSKVLVIGMGGLGSPVALYLAASGVGTLILADYDVVDLSNLQRQIAHFQGSIGANKAESANTSLLRINPHLKTELIKTRLDGIAMANLVETADLVIDSTDNAESRYLINQVCWKSKKPLISGAAIRWEGHVSMFDGSNISSPCYRCLYPNTNQSVDLNCANNGVISPLVGIIGSTQALEAVKNLTGIGTSLVGSVLYYDSKLTEWRKFTLKRLKNCPVCSI